MAPKDKDLEPISDRKIVERYLRYVLDLNEQLVCLAASGTICFEVTAKSFDEKNLGFTADISPESFDSLGTAELNALDSGADLRLSFSVQDVLFFAHGKITGRKSRTLSLVIDTPIFKLQRRNAMRIKVLNEHKSVVEVDGKSYIPHDLSATGVSFVVMPDEEPLFPLQRMIQSCRLRFAGLDVPVNLEVTSKSLLRKDNERLVKIGFRFLGLSPGIEQRLAREAYLHTHKIWSRWL